MSWKWVPNSTKTPTLYLSHTHSLTHTNICKHLSFQLANPYPTIAATETFKGRRFSWWLGLRLWLWLRLWPVVRLVGMVNMFAHLRWRHHAANASLQHNRQLSRRKRSLSHLQHAAMPRAAGLPCQPVCRLQRCPLRWHPIQMDASLRLCRAMCPNMQVSFVACQNNSRQRCAYGPNGQLANWLNGSAPELFTCHSTWFAASGCPAWH